MKKIFTLIVAVMATLNICATETVYNGILRVELPNTKDTIWTPGADVTMVENSGVYELKLMNFVLVQGSDPIYVGNISVPGLTLDTEGKFESNKKDNIVITAGADKTKTWVGPALSPVTGDIKGVLNDGKLNVSITMTVAGVQVLVSFDSLKPTATYSGNLYVTVADNPVPTSQSTIYLYEQSTGGYCLSLKNFILTMNGHNIAVGNIYVPDLSPNEDGSFKVDNTTILIGKGDDPTVESWTIAEMMKKVAGNVSGNFSDSNKKLSVAIGMNVGMDVKVNFEGNLTTDIEKVKANANVNAETSYNIAGQRVSENAKGIIILNGKKMVK